MTTLLVLIILAIGVIWLINKKPREAVEQQHAVPPVQHTAAIHVDEEDDDELIAVITAAIAEFTGTSAEEFKVLRIREQNANWALTGRQAVMHNRL